MLVSSSSQPSLTTLTGCSIVWSDDARRDAFADWFGTIAPTYQLQTDSLRAASADASFRRYFRVESRQGASYIVMDAPPDKENSEFFVRVATYLQEAGLLVPEILNWQKELGFMLLSDLGTETMLDVIDVKAGYEFTASTANRNLPLYEQAVDALIAWQQASKPGLLPPYDAELLHKELQLFPKWYVAQYRGIDLTASQQQVLSDAFDLLVANNLASPNVFVHRDFMPRNLMVPYPNLLKGANAAQQVGVLDFQDAVYGPVTYDIASLMRDAFLSWEEDFVLDVTVRYWQKAKKAGIPMREEWRGDFGAFYRAVEWMGLQRHLKILGIFARLTLRDHKPKYLADTPRFIHYVRHTCNRYVELKPLMRLIDDIEMGPQR